MRIPSLERSDYRCKHCLLINGIKESLEWEIKAQRSLASLRQNQDVSITEMFFFFFFF